MNGLLGLACSHNVSAWELAGTRKNLTLSDPFPPFPLFPGYFAGLHYGSG
jgi:hypothetical protein